MEAVKVQTVDDQEKEGIEQEFSATDVELSEAAEWLIALGEDEDEEYELIDEREVDYEREQEFDALWTFARVPSSNPAGKSEQDTDLIKVRYSYAGSQPDNKSRQFCRKMMTAGKVYRKEDIVGASQRAVNPGWGPEGANTYDLFFYKGGGSCRHFWSAGRTSRRTTRRYRLTKRRRLSAPLDPMRRGYNRTTRRSPSAPAIW